MNRQALALAAALAAASGADPALAQVRLYSGELRAGEVKGNVPGEQRTAAGMAILPRYLAHVGDYELSLEQVYVADSTPGRLASPFLANFSAGLKVLPFLELQAILGPRARVGARGPIFGNELGGLGWSAGYRIDDVALGRAGSAGSFVAGPAPPGVAEPLGPTFLPGVGWAQGGEVRLEGLRRFGLDFGFLDLALSPVAVLQGNRGGAGAEFAADLTFETATVGYTGDVLYNAYNPFETAFPTGPRLSALDMSHSLGARFILNDRFYLQTGYRFIVQDTYYNSWHLLSAGIGFRPLTADPSETPE